ncbi:MAG: sulfatase [bacterium]
MKNYSTGLLFIPLIFSFSWDVNRKTDKPNIVLINIDDMGWRDTGFTGSDFYETPNLDALAERGMIFSNAYASAANCAPSRACMMTGMWTPGHDIYTVGSSESGKSEHRKLIPVENITILDTSFTILPEVLNAEGYVTCHAGKWHLSEDPRDHGFDINIGGGHNGHPRSYYPPYKNVDIQPVDGKEYLTDVIMEKTIGFIDSADEPFFLYYSPYAVHTPIQGVDSLKKKYENKAHWEGQYNVEYATMIENLDRNIGNLLAKLKEKDHYDNTLIIFTSDNGGLYGITYQPPLRAGKGSYYEGGIRVPFFFVWEGRIRPNTLNETPITNLDLFPTIINCAGIDNIDLELEGMNLLPVLEEIETPPDRVLYWHFPVYLQAYDVSHNETRDSLFRTRPGSVLRHGKWKLHYYFEDQGTELYNLEEDPGERNDLSDENLAKTAELMEFLQNWWLRTSAPIPDELNPEFGTITQP